MAEFKDANSRVWTIQLDAPTIKRIREECDGLDLANCDGTTFDRLSNDPCVLVDALWSLCKKQAAEIQVDEVAFAKILVGDTIERATDAMLAAIADFFPQSKAKIVRAVAETTVSLRTEGLAKALEKISDPGLRAKLLAAQEKQMDSEIESLLTRLSSVTNTPVSAE